MLPHEPALARSGLLFSLVLVSLVPLLQGQTGCGQPPLNITITSPVHGAFSSAATILVQGTINKSPANHTVNVNGVPGTILTDNTWSATVPLDSVAIFNHLVATATNTVSGTTKKTRIAVIAGASVPEGDFSLDSVALRINDTGLDALEPTVGGLINLDLATLLPVGTVLINNQCFIDGGFVGCLGRATVSVSTPAPKIDSFSTAFDSQVDQVNADIDLNGLEINVFLSGTGLIPSCGIRLTATGTNISGLYALEPDAVDPSFIDVMQNGSVGVSFNSFNHVFTSGLCDVPVIGDIIGLFLPNIENTTRDGVANFLNSVDGNGNTPVAAAVEDALAGIDISGPIGAALGADLDSPLFAVTEDNDGITFGSDSRFVATCTPPPGAPDLSASYEIPAPFPAFGPTTPTSGTPYGVGICLSSSGMNQLLRAQTECGLLLSSITELDLGGGTVPLTAGTLALFIPQMGSFPGSTPVRIDIVPTLAPVFSGNPGPAGELTELKISYLLARIILNDGSESLLLEGAIDADLGVNLAVDEVANTLTFQLTPPPGTALTVVILKNQIGANEAQLELILPSVLAFFFPSLASSLGSFPIPSFLDLQLDVIEVERDGQFFSIFADLATVP